MIPHNRPTIEEADVEVVALVLRSGRIGQGKEVRAFEEEFAAEFGRSGWDGVAVSSGTAALYLTLRCLDIGRESSVLVPTYVCTALLHAISMAGANALLCDVRDSDFNLDPDLASRVSDSRLKAIILPHTYGVPSDPRPLETLGAPIIEDCAQAVGAYFGGRPVGSLSNMSVFSFYATKPMTCGQGGMVLGPGEMCEAIRDIRDYDGKRELKPRFNFQMTDFQAALGRSQLRRLGGLLARRRETAEMYCASLPKSMGRQESLPGAESNHFRFVIRLRQVSQARVRLEGKGIDTIVPTEPWELLHRQVGASPDGFPVAEELARTTLSLPIQPSLDDAEREHIAWALSSLGDLK